MKFLVCAAFIVLVFAQQQQITLGEVEQCTGKLQSKCPEGSDCFKEIDGKCFSNTIFIQSRPCKSAGDWYDDLDKKLSVYEDKQINSIPTPNQLTTLFAQYEKTSETSTKVDEYISEYTQLYNEYQANTQDQDKMHKLDIKYSDLRKIRRIVFEDQKVPFKIHSDYVACHLLCFDTLTSSSRVAYTDNRDCYQQRLSRQQVDTIKKESESEISIYSKQIKEKYSLQNGDIKSQSSVLIRITLSLLFSLIMILL